MATFIGLNEIQWLALSSIATTTGVLLALFIPILERKKERNNLVYFISIEIELIVSLTMYLKRESLNKVEAMDITSNYVRQFSFNFNTWNEKSGELAKYDRKLFELFQDIVTAAKCVKESEEQWLNTEPGPMKEEYRLLFQAAKGYLFSEVEVDIPLLNKYRLLRPRDPALRLAKKLHYGACHPTKQ